MESNCSLYDNPPNYYKNGSTNVGGLLLIGLKFVLLTIALGIVIAIPLGSILFDTENLVGTIYLDHHQLSFPFNFIFPTFGEGTEVAVLIVSIFWILYFGIKYAHDIFGTDMIEHKSKDFNSHIFEESESQKIYNHNILYLLLEMVIYLNVIAAAFSIMGYNIHITSSQMIYNSQKLLFLSVLSTIPYSVFFTFCINLNRSKEKFSNQISDHSLPYNKTLA